MCHTNDTSAIDAATSTRRPEFGTTPLSAAKADRKVSAAYIVRDGPLLGAWWAWSDPHMKVAYERLTDVDGVVDYIKRLSAKTVILDVEPLVAIWDSDQETLVRGVRASSTGSPRRRPACRRSRSRQTRGDACPPCRTVQRHTCST